MEQVERQQRLERRDNRNGRDVPEKHLKRETEDGTYEIRETGKEDSKIRMCRIRARDIAYAQRISALYCMLRI